MAMLVITRGYLPPTRRDQSSFQRHGFGNTGDMSHVIPGIDPWEDSLVMTGSQSHVMRILVASAGCRQIYI